MHVRVIQRCFRESVGNWPGIVREHFAPSTVEQLVNHVGTNPVSRGLRMGSSKLLPAQRAGTDPLGHFLGQVDR